MRDEYSQLGTMAKRRCELAIVDKVDSMLIDDSSKISRLSCKLWKYHWSKKFLESTNDISQIGQFIEGETEEFLKKHIEKYLREELFDKLTFPNNFKKFVEK